MDSNSTVPGLDSLHEKSLGDPTITIAVLDGPVDPAHPCFAGSDLIWLDTVAGGRVAGGRMSRHGTHVASMIFGQPGSSVQGIAPRCRGIVVPIFSDVENGRLPQLELARAIEQALEAGANIINISGGERASVSSADPILRRALQLCQERDVLVVAAAGNDGCDCVHVPAAIPSVLAVGALGIDGRPLETSNWGEEYRNNGILAPGEGILGASPGGGSERLTGTSFATPIVTGIVALLLSIQQQTAGRRDPRAVADDLLLTAIGCDPAADQDCRRFLAGVINVPGAYARVASKGRTIVEDITASTVSNQELEVMPAGPAVDSDTALATLARPGPNLDALHGVRAAEAPELPPTAVSAIAPAGEPARTGPASGSGCPPTGCPGVRASGCGCAGGTESYVYALGSIGFDFGTEARRDTFRQLMPDVERDASDGTVMTVSPNPYDVFQLVDYLDGRPSESTKLIFTLNLDLTPIYAVEAERDYPEDVYATLRDALRFQALPVGNDDHVARVSIPGRLTGKTVQLFSGQRVPVVVAQPRGLYMWNEPLLVKSVVSAVQTDALNRGAAQSVDEDYVSKLVRTFLDKVYFECRNLGASPPDRALNFAATNAYQFAQGVAGGLLSGNMVPGAENDLYALDSISVSKSPYCRMDSDCWDVQITFFDPVNDRRAKSIYQYTIDVSDVLPVSLAPAHQYLTS